jgi:hypothetical protein
MREQLAALSPARRDAAISLLFGSPDANMSTASRHKDQKEVSVYFYSVIIRIHLFRTW